MTTSTTDPLQSFMLQIAQGKINPQQAAITIQTIIEQVALQLVKNEMAAINNSGTSIQCQHGSITRSEQSGAEKDCGCGCGGTCDSNKQIKLTANGHPNFENMTQAEKLAYNQAKRDRVFGKL